MADDDLGVFCDKLVDADEGDPNTESTVTTSQSNIAGSLSLFVTRIGPFSATSAERATLAKTTFVVNVLIFGGQVFVSNFVKNDSDSKKTTLSMVDKGPGWALIEGVSTTLDLLLFEIDDAMSNRHFDGGKFYIQRFAYHFYSVMSSFQCYGPYVHSNSTGAYSIPTTRRL